MATELPVGISIPDPVRSIISDEKPGAGVLSGQNPAAKRENIEPSILTVIASLETKFFEHDFPSESAEDRLQRLEQLIFGQSKAGDFKERSTALQNAASKNESVKQISANNGSALHENLSMLERRFFQRDYHSDNSNERLNRLEHLAFGAAKTGSPEARIKVIKRTLQNPAELAAEEAAADAARAEKANSNPSAKPSFGALLDEGIKEFRAQRYHHAQDAFEKAIALNSRSAEAYANLGGVLLMLRDKQGAQDCFKACYALHPFGPMGQYAREQILKLVHDDAYSKTDPQDSQDTVARTVALINRQSADRARTAQYTAGLTARNRLTLTDIEIQKMSADTQEALADLRANRGYYAFYGGGRTHYDRAATDPYNQREISDLNYIRTNYLRTDGQVQANAALIDGYQRSSSAFESGTNLKNQLLQPVAPGAAHLRALGTSLYARYYGDGTPSTDDPPVLDAALPGLLATPKTLNTK